MSLRFQEPAIWVAALLLLIGFVLMFIREDMESNPQLVHEWDEIGRISGTWRKSRRRSLPGKRMHLSQKRIAKALGTGRCCGVSI